MGIISSNRQISVYGAVSDFAANVLAVNTTKEHWNYELMPELNEWIERKQGELDYNNNNNFGTNKLVECVNQNRLRSTY